jgi:2-polyprenyl-6-methoxyphenol hydroxylase-like FAD-dependent oxidoreductase
MARLKVLIVGGGIAGSALAFWLSKSNHNVTVVERYPDLQVIGLQVDLRRPDIKVLKRMGLNEEFHAYAAKEQGS